MKSSDGQKKIIIFTIDDDNFMPDLLTPLISSYSSQISHIYISRSLFGYSKLLKKAKFLIKNLYPFCISFSDLLKIIFKQIENLFQRKDKNGLKELFKKNNISYSFVKNINNPDFIKKLKSKNPDLILFSVFDQIANSQVISLPTFGTFNVHLGPLPSYKGGFSSFWVLRNSEKFTGASIHCVTSKIDEGDLIEEVIFEIDTKSMYELMKKNVNLIAKQLPKTIKNIFDNKVQKIDISMRENYYYYYPSKDDFKEFYKNKCRLI